MALPRKIIVVRHGKTHDDKSDPNRTLTEEGIEELQKTRDEVSKHLQGEVGYFTTNKKRAIDTLMHITGSAMIDRNEWNFKVDSGEKFDKVVAEGRSKGITPAYLYMELDNYEQWDVESPQELQQRWRDYLLTTGELDTALIITHEGAIEAFVETNEDYDETETNREGRYFGYGEFAILQLKE